MVIGDKERAFLGEAPRREEEKNDEGCVTDFCHEYLVATELHINIVSGHCGAGQWLQKDCVSAGLQPVATVSWKWTRSGIRCNSRQFRDGSPRCESGSRAEFVLLAGRTGRSQIR